MRSQPVMAASTDMKRLPSRLALGAGAVSLLVHIGLATLVLTRRLVPETSPPAAGITVSIEASAPATTLADDAPPLRPVEIVKDDHPVAAAPSDAGAVPNAALQDAKPEVWPGELPALQAEPRLSPFHDAGPVPARMADSQVLPQILPPVSPAAEAEAVRPGREASGLDATPAQVPPAPAAIDAVAPFVPKDASLVARSDDTPAAMPEVASPEKAAPPPPDVPSPVIPPAPIERPADAVATAPLAAVSSAGLPSIVPPTKALDAAPVQPAQPTQDDRPEAIPQAAEPSDAPKQVGASAPAQTASASIEAAGPSPLSAPPAISVSTRMSSPEGKTDPVGALMAVGTLSLPAPDVEATLSVVKPSSVEAVRVGGAPPVSDPLLQSSSSSAAPRASEPSPVTEQHAATDTASRPTAVAMLAAPHAIGDMIGYIRRYDGGSCFFVSPTKITSENADIDSFSDSSDRIKAFNDAFFSEMGLDPDVAGQRVSKAQCPVVDFLKATRGGDAREMPALHVDRRYLRSGDIVSGGIQGFDDRHLTLLLVSETGAVENVTARLSRQGDETTFSLPLRHEREGGPFPQMLVAIGSRGPLPEAALPGAIKDGAFQSLIERASHDPYGLRTASKLIFISH